MKHDTPQMELTFPEPEPKIFSAAEMAERWARLKRDNRVPDLTKVLEIVRREVTD